jgi:prefoldin subunit 5
MNEEVEELEHNLSTAIEEKESTNLEDLERQIEMLRNEVCSIRADIEKLSTTKDSKRSASRDKHINELFLKGVKQKGINFY